MREVRKHQVAIFTDTHMESLQEAVNNFLATFVGDDREDQRPEVESIQPMDGGTILVHYTTAVWVDEEV